MEANMIQEIRHTPYGLEHPYKQGPDERFPRDPLAGQPVSLGVVTAPAGAAEAVGAIWNRAGVADQNISGRRIEDQEGKSFWRVDLPAFSDAEEIRYRLFALQGNNEIRTDEYLFRVRSWCPIDSLTSWMKTGEQLDLVLKCEKGELDLVLSLSFPSASQMKMSWRKVGNEGPIEAPKGRTSFQLSEKPAGRIVVKTSALQVVITTKPFTLSVKDAAGKLLLNETDPIAILTDGSRKLYSLRQCFSSPSEEGFYGFGERFNAFNQRGQKLDVRVFEEFATLGIKNYIPMPYFLSSRGYGLFLQTNRYVSFDLAASQAHTWSYEVELGASELVDVHLFTSPEPAQIIRAFTGLTGKPALPPSWVFGPWMSGNEWDRQARIQREIELTQEHDIPATVIVLEAWSDESTFYIWNDAIYRPKPGGESFSYADFSFPPDGRWPDPKGMIDWLHAQGLRVLLWQIPVLKKLDTPHPQKDNDEAHMLEQQLAVLAEDGQPYRVRPFWFHNGLLLDFTNPEAVSWWLQKRAYLLDELGIDGFKTDGGEHLWGRGAHFSNGMRGDEGWNIYANLYVGAYYRFTTEKRNGDAITFSRAGSAGAQAFPCHWAGDEFSTWDAYRGAVLAGLNAGLSGIPFWAWDLAGFSGEVPSAELYLRSAAMAAFCPIMQYHMDYNAHHLPSRDRTPWNIAERSGKPEVIVIYRKFACLRMKMLPYIEQEARYCAETGEPLMRPLFLDWPKDQQVWEIADQYSFGRALLVAPILHPGQTERKVYLPQGEWENFWNGEHFTGGQEIVCQVPLDEIPVFRRLDMLWPGLAE